MKYNFAHTWKNSEKKTEALKLFMDLMKPTGADNIKQDVYRIKHFYESFVKTYYEDKKTDYYVYTDEFIYHAIRSGFKYKHVKNDREGRPHGYVNFNKKIIRQLKYPKLY